ncbi:TRAP transporter substrate-binding protein [Halomonas cupida]|uniref:Exported protein n=1 Tax=Halomonas cupida TaxID=44933 RepID=A0A1M7CVB0_9GAMM|nr:TRAP transporter substrate-binding protein [Halomonas cupida]GEN25894.1 exported protein [Halomonas cupida]SHL71120.1 TRAP-type C4-dicarboxylate transport system, substrate-binding protein [Halomonas cupida]
MTISTPTSLATAVALALVAGSANAADWNLATPYGDASFHTVNTKQFAEDVREATGGELNINVHSGGSLISHGEIKPSVRRGTVQAGEVFLSILSNESTVFELDTLPGLAGSYDEAWQLWQASKPAVEMLFDHQGLMPLYAVPWPSQGIYTDFELNDPAQFQGLRVRAPNINTQRLTENLGGLPTETEESDIPTAFSTGRVDAMITSVSTGESMAAWDYVSHFSDANLWIPKNIVFVNRQAFESLDADVQQAVLDAAEAAEQRGWEASKADAAGSTQALTEHGISISSPNEAVAGALQAAGDELFEEWESRADAGARQLVEKYRASLQ